MASLVLGIVGNAIAPGVGGFVGALVGSAIDNFLIFPALFPQDNNFTGPRLDGLSFSSANEGKPIEWLIGAKTRTPGQVIWLDELEEVVNEDDVDTGPSGPPGATATTYTYFVNFAMAIGEVTGDTDDDLYTKIKAIEKVFGDAKLLWDNGETARYDDITWYYGDQSAPDPFLEGKLGAGNVPNFKRMVYCVIQRLAIADFGNRVPNLQIITRQGSNISMGEALRMIAERAGLDPNTDISVSRVPFCLRGLNWSGPKPTKAVYDLLTATYGMTAQDVGGVLTFFQRGTEDEFDVLDGDAGTLEEPGFTIESIPEWDVPAASEVRFVSFDQDAQPGLESYFEYQRGIADDLGKIVMDVPITLTAREADLIAKRVVFEALIEREKVSTFTLPPSYFFVAAGDVLNLYQPDGTIFRMLVTELTYGANYEIQVSGHRSYAETYDQVGSSADVYNPNSGGSVPDLDVEVLDIPGLSERTADGTNLHVAIRQRDAAATGFRGALVYAGADRVAEPSLRTAMPNLTKMGVVTDPLERGPERFVWDDASTVDVTVYNGETLSSVTDAELIAGGPNVAAIRHQERSIVGFNWEVFAFATATPLGTDEDGNQQYRLSRLLRGLFGSQASQGLHVGEAPIVFLEANKIGFFNAAEYLGASTYVKAAPIGAILDDVPFVGSPVLGNSGRPRAPINLRYQKLSELLRDPSGSGANRDHLFTWDDVGKIAGGDPLSISANATADEENQWVVEVRRYPFVTAAIFGQYIVNEPYFYFTQTMRDELGGITDFFPDKYAVTIRKQTTLPVEGLRASYLVEEF
ncbi:MAG: hypothetical protein CMJ75_18695 [Planctomycetaceae bacterium]|nr:hypothetical protein [Planctomycetaceae bacterium]